MSKPLRYNDYRTDRGALQHEYRVMIKLFGGAVASYEKGLNAEDYYVRRA